MNVLFVCSANVDRSKTAEDFFSEQFIHHAFRSAGTNQTICEQKGTNFLNQEMIDWADVVYAMEPKHEEWLRKHLNVKEKQINVLGIEDRYSYYSIQLIEILQQKCNRAFE